MNEDFDWFTLIMGILIGSICAIFLLWATIEWLPPSMECVADNALDLACQELFNDSTLIFEKEKLGHSQFRCEKSIYSPYNKFEQPIVLKEVQR